MTRPAPFYVAPDDGQRFERRLLLLSHSFPPMRVVGALRWQKLAELAAERGWAVDVVMQQPPCELLDPESLDLVPAGARLFGVPLREPLLERVQRQIHLFARRSATTDARDGIGNQTPAADDDGMLARLGRANRVGLYYSAHRAWAHEAASVASGVVTQDHAAVVSSGPPHMAHVGGALVARRHSLPFAMDLRDPWSLGLRAGRELDSPLWWALARYFERQALAEASLVIANTEMLRVALCNRYPALADRVITAMNGSDDDPLPPRQVDERFVVAYAGSLYWDRDPRPLFRAAASVIRRLELTPRQFSVELMGDVRFAVGVPVQEMAREAGIAEYVTLHRDDTRRHALDFLARADVLVSLPLVVGRGEADVDLTVPAKIFEYARFDAWLLALADRGSATEQFLRDTSADVVAPEDVNAIADVLLKRYEERRRGVRPRPIDDGRYSRRAQGTRLLDALEKRLAPAGARRPLAAPTQPPTLGPLPLPER